MFSFQELGILDNPNYRICFLLDSGAMITVLSSKYGLIEVGYDFTACVYFIWRTGNPHQVLYLLGALIRCSREHIGLSLTPLQSV